MRVQLVLPMALGAVLFSMSAFAKDDVWGAKYELGSRYQTGNSKALNINSRISVFYSPEHYENKFVAESLFNSSNDIRTEEKYALSGESKYFHTKHNYFFGNVEAIKQHFKPYDQIYTLEAGAGYRLINEANLTLDLQAGPGWRYSREVATRDHESNAILGTTGQLLWQVNDNVKFEEAIVSRSGSDNSFIESTTGLSTKLNSQLSLKLEYVVEYNSKIPSGSTSTSHTDTLFSVNLVYKV